MTGYADSPASDGNTSRTALTEDMDTTWDVADPSQPPQSP